MSFAAEVIADGSNKFIGNRLRFATRAEAEAWVHDLSMRWMMVYATRVVESEDPVSSHYDAGRQLIEVPL